VAPDVHAWAIEHAVALPSSSAGVAPVGSVVFDHLTPARARELANRFALPLTAVDRLPDAPRHELDLPRVAIYHTWFSTQDAGWARYTFEQSGIPYTSIDKDDLRAGALRKRFDVIVVPEVNASVAQWIHGVDAKWSPLPFRQTRATPALGVPDASPDITGGPGFEGLAALQSFVETGGTLITLGAATRLAAETGIARALSPHAARALFHPGSVVRVRARAASSPVLYGYPDVTTIFRGNGPLFEVAARDSAMLVLQYGARRSPPRPTGEIMGMPSHDSTAHPDAAPADSAHTDSARALPAHRTDEEPRGDTTARAPHAAAESDSAYVVSGMVRGEDEIIGEGAIFDVPVGRGRVVAFTFNPLHRYLNHHEFPMVWNAIANWNDHPRMER
jgi:hypothetical protein